MNKKDDLKGRIKALEDMRGQLPPEEFAQQADKLLSESLSEIDRLRATISDKSSKVEKFLAEKRSIVKKGAKAPRGGKAHTTTEAEGPETAELKRTIKALTADNQRLLSGAHSQAQKDAGTLKEFEDNKSLSEGLKADLEQTTASLNTAQGKYARLLEKHSTAEDDHLALRKTADTLAADKERLERQLNSLRLRAEQDAASRISKTNTLQREKEDLLVQTGKMETLRQEVQALQTHNSGLQAELTAQGDKAGQDARLKAEEIRDLLLKAETLGEERDSLARNAAEARQEADSILQRSAAAENKATVLQARIVALEDEAASGAGNLDVLRQEADSLRQKVDKNTQDNAAEILTLTEGLTKTVAENEAATVALHDSETENTRLKAELGQQQAATEKLTTENAFEIQALRDSQSKDTAEKELVFEKLVSAESERQDLIARVEAFDKDESERKEEIETLRHGADTAKAEITRLQTELDGLGAKAQSDSGETASELQSLTEEVQSLGDALEKAAAEKAEVLEKLVSAESERQALLAQVEVSAKDKAKPEEAEPEEEINALRHETDTLRAEITRLQTQLDGPKAGPEDLDGEEPSEVLYNTQEIRTLKEELTRVVAEKEGVFEKLISAESERQGLLDRVDVFKKDEAARAAEADALRAEIARLQTQLDGLKVSPGEHSEEKASEVQSYTEEIQSLYTEEIKSLKKELTRAVEEKEGVFEKLITTESEKQGLLARVDVFKNDEAARAGEIEALRTEANTLNKETVNLQTKLAGLKAESQSDADKAASRAKTLSAEVQTLTGDLKEAAGEKAEALEKLAEAEAISSKAASEAQTLSEGAQSLSEEVQTLSAEVQTLTGDLKEAAGEKAEALEKLSEAQSDSSKAASEAQSLSEGIQSLKDALTEAASEKAEALEKLSEAQSDSSEAASEVLSLSEGIQSLKDALTEAAGEKAEALEKLSEAQSDSSEAASEVLSLSEGIQSIKDTLSEAAREKAEALEKLADAESEKQGMLDRMETIENDEAVRAGETEALRHEADTLNEEKAHLQTELEELMATSKEAEAKGASEVLQLTERLEALDSEKETLSKALTDTRNISEGLSTRMAKFQEEAGRWETELGALRIQAEAEAAAQDLAQESPDKMGKSPDNIPSGSPWTEAELADTGRTGESDVSDTPGPAAVPPPVPPPGPPFAHGFCTAFKNSPVLKVGIAILITAVVAFAIYTIKYEQPAFMQGQKSLARQVWPGTGGGLRHHAFTVSANLLTPKAIDGLAPAITELEALRYNIYGIEIKTNDGCIPHSIANSPAEAISFVDMAGGVLKMSRLSGFDAYKTVAFKTNACGDGKPGAVLLRSIAAAPRGVLLDGLIVEGLVPGQPFIVRGKP